MAGRRVGATAKTRTAILALAATLIAAPAPAAPPQHRELQALMDRAARQYRAGDYRGALAALRQVDARVAVPIVRFNIARCLEELGEARAAVEAFERYLALDDEPDRQRRAREAIRRLESTALGRVHVTCTPVDARIVIEGLLDAPASCPVRLERVPVGVYALIATHPEYAEHARSVRVDGGAETRVHVELQVRGGTFSVDSVVPGGEVYLDDVLVAAVPIREMPLPPGEYTITVRTPGYDDWSRRVTIVPGGAVELVADPRRPAPAAPPPPSPSPFGDEDPKPPPPDGLDPLPLGLAAGAGVSLAVGAAFYLRAADDADRVRRFDAAYGAARTPSRAEATWAALEAARGDAHRNRALAYVFLGMGTALAAGSTWLFLAEEPAPATPTVDIAPTAGGGVLEWSGRW